MQRENGTLSAQLDFTLTQPEKNQADLLTAIERFAVQLALSDALRYRLALIVDEVVTNCIVHGACNSKNQTIKVHILDQESELIIEISDTGRPFDPTTHPLSPCPEGEPVLLGGAGLCLVRRLANGIKYTRSRDHNHLLISLNKAKQETACSFKK
jgi:anti-sigma regulatory factor (Ser/Thr protein kinase)